MEILNKSIKIRNNYDNCIFEFKRRIVNQFIDPNEYAYFVLPGTKIYNCVSQSIRYLFRGYQSHLFSAGPRIYDKFAKYVAMLPRNYWYRDILLSEYNYIVQERIKLYMKQYSIPDLTLLVCDFILY
jgi:hypothetical protein